MKSIFICFFIFFGFNIYSQDDEFIVGIDDYISKTKWDSVSEYSEQLDDEYHNYKIFTFNGEILKIEGIGSGEFRAFKYEFYFRNDTLIYSDYFNKALKGHWSEFEGREYEYHEREEYIYYLNNQPYKISGSDSELENQIQTGDSESLDNQNEENIEIKENQIYCVDFAYELLEKLK
ncbi:MAG: hypothetical protein IPM71_08085 [Bacteroidota bacterium]|nr:MAG: hypothetical protein IPM71_08085 [Bacteroidota bacterium]